MKRVAGSVINTLWMVLVLLLVASPAQAKFYKWTDEAGNVHYSQNPPPDQEAKSLDIKVKPPETGASKGANTPKSNGTGAPIRCGSIMVPPPRRDAASSIAMYREAIGVWQQYISENQEKGDEAAQQGIQDRRCAIEQANKALEGLSETAQNLDAMHQEVVFELQELEAQLAECDNPDRDPEERSAAACKQHYKSQIKRLKQQQRKMIPLGAAPGELPRN